MSIKLLHPDARFLLKCRIEVLSEMLARHEQRYTKVIPGFTYGVDFPFPETYPEEYLSRRNLLKSSQDEYLLLHDNEKFWTHCMTQPCLLNMPYECTSDIFGRKIFGPIFIFAGSFYSVKGPYNTEEMKLLLIDYAHKKKRKIEYLIARKNFSDSQVEYERRPIPENIRHEVWRRDQGKCVQCGSTCNLEFDHIIPVSRGGANTVRNIQLLCEPCNRRKSDQIG